MCFKIPSFPKVCKETEFLEMFYEREEEHQKEYENALAIVTEAEECEKGWNQKYGDTETLKRRSIEQLKDELFKELERYQNTFVRVKEMAKEMIQKMGETLVYFKISPLEKNTLSSLQKMGFDLPRMEGIYQGFTENVRLVEDHRGQWDDLYKRMEICTNKLKQSLNNLAMYCGYKPETHNRPTPYFACALAEFFQQKDSRMQVLDEEKK